MLDASYFSQTTTTTTVQQTTIKRVHVSRAEMVVSEGGILSQRLPGYRVRTPQIELVRGMDRAIREGISGAFEAPTGTGKSFAEIIAPLLQGKKFILCTSSKALQDQLAKNDVPFIQKYVENFEVVVLKGKGNYLCERKLQEEAEEGMQRYVEDAAFNRVSELVDAGTFNSDFEQLPFSISPELKEKINVDDTCSGKDCPLYKQCGYQAIRRKLPHVQAILTNQNVVMEHVKSGGRILPAVDVIIFDEAHHLVENATSTFATKVTLAAITRAIKDKKIRPYLDEKAKDTAIRKAELLWKHLEARLPRGTQADKTKYDLTEPIEEGLHLATLVGKLATQLESKKPLDLPEDENKPYDALVKRLVEKSKALRRVFSVDNEEYVYYLEDTSVTGKDRQVQIAMEPIDVAPLLSTKLFDQYTVICVSATLAIREKGNATFRHFQRSIGMDEENSLSLALPHTFDYAHNTLLYLTGDARLIPPNKDENTAAKVLEYEKTLAWAMYRLVCCSRGRAFLLFTSRYMMNSVAARIAPLLETQGYPMFVQNGELSTNEMIAAFKTSGNGVLLGLDTFWEGVDVPGTALSLVAIDKLPFPTFDDPVHQARINRIKANGGNSFAEYLLPQTILRIKQGVGRLIRKEDDQGVIAILDARMENKAYRYGPKIKECLPPSPYTYSLKTVESFFDHEFAHQIQEGA